MQSVRSKCHNKRAAARTTRHRATFEGQVEKTDVNFFIESQSACGHRASKVPRAAILGRQALGSSVWLNLWCRTAMVFVFGYLAANLLVAAPTFTEYSTPGFVPTAIANGPDGNVWITAQSGGRIAKVSPSGAATEYLLPNTPRLATPRGIARGADGSLWVTDTFRFSLYKVTTAGVATEIVYPGAGCPDTGCSGGGAIVGPADGSMWFARYGAFMKYSPQANTFNEYVFRRDGAGARVHSFALAADGSLWFTDDGGVNETIGKIAPNGTITMLPAIPNMAATTIEAGSSGVLWFAASKRVMSGGNVLGAIGRIDIATNGLTLFDLPDNVRVSDIALASDGNAWFATGANRVGQITPSGQVTMYTVPGGREPDRLILGPNNDLWYTVPSGTSPSVGRIGGIGSNSQTGPDCSLVANPNPVTFGSAVLLTATCSPAAASYVWTGTGFSSTTSSGSITPTATTTYTVTGKNPAGASGNTASVTVTVTPVSAGAPTCNLSATPNSISAGGTSTLAASCTPAAASYVWTNTGFSSNSASGTVSPPVTTTYSVTGRSASGTSGNTASATVTVTSVAAATPTCSLTATPSMVQPGQTVTLMTSCNPSATSYSWANVLGPETATGATRTVTVTGSMAWSVRGINAAGAGNVATASVTAPNTLSAVAVATGANHSCAIGTDGALRCWGRNHRGQVGNGTLDQIVVTPATIFSSGVTKVSAGENHTCAIVNRVLYCWGDNSVGQLGVGGTNVFPTVSVPVSVFGGGATAVSAGFGHTCAVVNTALWCWGANDAGQVGSGSAVLTEPSPVQVLTSSNAVSAGGQHTCAEFAGNVTCWGSNTYGQLGVATTTTSIRRAVDGRRAAPTLTYEFQAKHHRTCISFGSQTSGVQCWGLDFDRLAATPPTTVIASGLTNDIAIGERNVCAVVNEALVCWGSPNDAIGLSSSGSSALPPRTIVASGVRNVALGASHVCAIIGGVVECWGGNAYGQIAKPPSGAVQLRNVVGGNPVLTGSALNVVEYIVPTLNKYFITGRDTEKATLAQFSGAYSLTGMQFRADFATNPPAGMVPICRFYFAPPMANTHFYGPPSDCALIASANTGNAAVTNEGLDFAVTIPDASGNCPPATPVKVYRSFNNRAGQNDGNHRYTVSQARYNQMTARGYAPEGPVFCATSAVDATQ